MPGYTISSLWLLISLRLRWAKCTSRKNVLLDVFHGIKSITCIIKSALLFVTIGTKWLEVPWWWWCTHAGCICVFIIFSSACWHVFSFFSTEVQMLHGRWIEPRHDKTCLMLYANNKDADQPAHPRSLISVVVVRCLDTCSIISVLAISKVWRH